MINLAAWLVLLTALGLIVVNITAILNALTFPRLGKWKREYTSSMRNMPALSVLIPARNEAGVIASTVQALLAQDYPDFEIIILDDHSSDNTTQLASSAAGGDPRLRVMSGLDLPPGWLGKNWACQQLSQAARPESEWLLFSDADVRWQPGALQALVMASQDLHGDMATVWPTQITHTWPERLVVPLMAQAIIGYLPLLAVHYLPLSIFAAANGQCLLFQRSAYRAVGEHSSVYDSVIEDVSLARHTKKLGFNLRMLDGDRLVACRMYTSWAEVRDGFAKNILAGHGNSLPFLVVSTLAHWLAFIMPVLWLALGGLAPDWPFGLFTAWPVIPLYLVILGFGVRLLSAAVTHQRLADALLMPVSVVLMTIIAFQAIKWRFSGGPRWKDRVVGNP